MKTEKFTELTVGLYKLVDKESWLSRFSENRDHYELYFNKTEDSVHITEVMMGNGLVEGTLSSIISVYEYEFFEKVIERGTINTTQPITTKNINTITHETNHTTENLVRNRTAWSLAQEVLRLREDKLALQEQLLGKGV